MDATRDNHIKQRVLGKQIYVCSNTCFIDFYSHTTSCMDILKKSRHKIAQGNKRGERRGKRKGETSEKIFNYLIFKLGHKDALWVDVTCPSRWHRTATLSSPQQRMIL